MKKITSILFYLLAIAASAQIGNIDTTFSTGMGPDGPVDMATLQPDGKIIIVGGFKNYNGISRNCVARVNPDGSLDTSFNPGTGVVALTEYLNTAILQPDGKIIIAGDFTLFNGTPRNRIARLNADGSIDTGFNPGTGANSRVVSVSLQPDGKIIMAGQFTTFNSLSQNRIARLNTNGSLDSSFAIGTGANQYIWTTCLQPDGKIIIGGGFTLYNGITRNYYARLNTNGSVDTSFAIPTSTPNQSVLVTALQPDGKILLGGYFTQYAGVARARIARTNADGTLDTTFNPGTGNDAYPITLAVQPDGRIIMGGDFTTYNGSVRNRLARINANGSLDTGFNGTGLNSILYWAALQPDGKMVLGGNFTTYNGADSHPFLVRLLAYDANVISVGALSAASPFCQNQSLSVNYNVQGFYQAGNVFTAQLSNASGSFASPVTVGSSSGTTSGSMTITMPANAVGLGYRIRIVSSLPVTIGSDNGSNLSINASATYYADADADGYGNPALPTQACAQPVGYVTNNTDCNDALATVHPGALEILYNGVDDNCNGTLDDGNQLTTTIVNPVCGSTLATLSSLIACPSLGNITKYRFEVTNTATNAVQTIDRTQNFFSLTMLPAYEYAAAYSIKVQLQRNNVWLGYYGPACLLYTQNVLAPGGAASIVGGLCNTVLPTISTLIATNSIPNVTGYKFRVVNNTNALAPNHSQVYESPLPYFNLTQLATFHYGTTYTIQVAVKTNGNYTAYGISCTVSSPPVPQLANCGGVIESASTLVTTLNLDQVTRYRFQITNLLTNIVTTVDRPFNYFTFRNIPMYNATGLYTVQISLKTSGSWSPFGNICQITAPPASRMAAPKNAKFLAVAHPNPFSDSFAVATESNEKEFVSIKVYDMTGRLLESTGANFGDISELKLGSQYPSGVYNIVVSQGENLRALRVVKR